ncbi:DUF6894 family protein [Methylobacterium soli]|uniref:DUF6894 domain-containing protein n=1 Tax=Methylobacterium soli TaxID=553447 RepID=A0A6L3SSZ4_9HYPH|nr:hypothetical protein [Methylobacterium soli]KAB1072694.1 hypothetical protein F6X53_27815 [Methylobacterium soli]GJE45826.1 hypothetical protein AEGHOMDF_5026 [Methylobacterium soli]
MPRYFFDVQNGRDTRDHVGTECATLEEACQHAKEVLPEITSHELPRGGDRQAFTLLVRNEQGHPVYSAALMFVGLVLTE